MKSLQALHKVWQQVGAETPAWGFVTVTAAVGAGVGRATEET